MRKNEHQEHLENLIFYGKDEYVKTIRSIVSSVEGSANDFKWSYKIDGSPAVVIYNQFAGLRGTGVCLKYMNPDKCYTSNEEVDAAYDDNDHPESFRDMLKWCISLAKQVPKGEAYQGDCLFTSDTLTSETIGGKKYICFQPNKVVYGVLEGTEEWKLVGTASFGIALHTKYTGSIDNLSQTFNFNLNWFDGNENYYIMKADADLLFKVDDINALKQDANELESLMDKYEESCTALFQNEYFDKYFMPVENYFLNTKGDKNLNANAVCKEIKRRVKEDYKTPTTLREKLANLEEITDAIIDSVELINKTIAFKNKVISAIRYDPDTFDTFYKTSNGDFEDANIGEGFTVSDKAGDVFKIVDRTDFSTKNRSSSYTSGFKHEAISLYALRRIDENRRANEIAKCLLLESHTPPQKANVFNTLIALIANSNETIYIAETNPTVRKMVEDFAKSAIGDSGNVNVLKGNKDTSRFLLKCLASSKIGKYEDISKHLRICLNGNCDWQNANVKGLQISEEVDNYKNVKARIFDEALGMIKDVKLHVSKKSIGYYNLLKSLMKVQAKDFIDFGAESIGEENKAASDAIREMMIKELGYICGDEPIEDLGITRYQISKQKFALINKQDMKPLAELIVKSLNELTHNHIVSLAMDQSSDKHTTITLKKLPTFKQRTLLPQELTVISEALVLLDQLQRMAKSSTICICIPEKSNFLFYDLVVVNKVNGEVSLAPISVKTENGHKPSAIRYITKLESMANEYKEFMDALRDSSNGSTARKRLETAFINASRSEKGLGLDNYEDYWIHKLSCIEGFTEAIKKNFTGEQAFVALNGSKIEISYDKIADLDLKLKPLKDPTGSSIGMEWS